MKKSKTKATDGEKVGGALTVSLFVFLFDKLSAFVYESLKNGVFGKLFTSYSAIQSEFEDGLIRNHFANSRTLRRWIRSIQKMLSKYFESSLFVNIVDRIIKSFVALPLKSIGTFMLSFGVYVIIMYVIRSFLPIVEEANLGFLITGISVCTVSVPMLFSRDNIARAVGESSMCGALFSDVFGFREEAYEKEEKISRWKINLLVFFGMLLGLSTIIIHPLWIILAISLMVGIALVIVIPEIGIIVALFSLPFLSILKSPAIAIGMIVMTVIISYFIKLIRGKRILKFELFDLAVLFFLGIIFFSGTITAGGSMGYQEALITCELMLGYFLTVNMIRTEKWIYRCVYALVTSGTIVAGIGIFQYVFGVFQTGAWLDINYFYDIEGRATSVLDNPNVLGMYLVMILPFAMYALIKSQNGSPKLLCTISVSAILLCILLTWSRGAWISAIICVVLFMIMYSRKTLRYIFMSCLFVPFLPFILPSSVTRRFLSIGDIADSSTMYRLYTWRGTIRAIGDYFFGGIGYGPTAFREIYPQYAYAGIEAAAHSHNLFLQIAIGTGLIGLVAFAVIIFLYLQMNFEYLKSFDGKFALVVIACISAVSSILVFGFFDFVWYNYRLFFLFWVIVAISVACIRIAKDDMRRHSYNDMSDSM